MASPNVKTVEVLFFGATADAAGRRSETISIDDSADLGTAVNDLVARYPSLANHRLLTAVNEEYADSDTTLKDGDEIAIFTAVSGG